jgi:hypothetical protein
MRSKTIFTILFLVVLVASQALAQNAARDNFPYPNGVTVIGMGGASNGFSDAWHLDPGDTGVRDSLFWPSDTGIVYGDLPYSYPHAGKILFGNRPATQYARYERTLSQVWTTDAGTEYWFSAFMQLKNDTNVATWAGIKLVQDHSDAAVMFGKGHGMAFYTCGGGWHGGPGEEVSSVRWDVGPVWLVARIVNKGVGVASRVYMWINPNPAAKPDTTTADAKTWYAPNPGIAYVRVEFGGDAGFQMGTSDIRMGTTWASVSTSLVSTGFAATESFNYAKSVSVIGQGDITNGWKDAWHLDPGDTGVRDSLYWPSDTGIVYGDMSYSYPHVGRMLLGSRPATKYARYERTLDKVWTTGAGTEYWFSAFMQLKSDTNTATWAGVKIVQDHSDAAVMFGKGHGMAFYTCGGGWHGGPGEEVSSVRWDVGPVWLVGRMVNKGVGVASRVYMWINPNPATKPDTTTADAKTWYAPNPGLAYVRVEYGGDAGFQMGVDEIRLGTTWASVSSALTDVPRSNNTPMQFVLDQNYPNPFNPSTSIAYSLKNTGKVTLKVYNLLGKEVATLVNGVQGAGQHTATFAGTNLASGIYFYTLDSAGEMLTKKMVLLK